MKCLHLNVCYTLGNVTQTGIIHVEGTVMALGCLLTHGFVKEQRVPCQMVCAEQAAQDADGALKQINIHILVEGKLRCNPLLSFFKFYRRTQK